MVAATALLPQPSLHPLPTKAVVAVVAALGALVVVELTALEVESHPYQSRCQTLLLRRRVLPMDPLLPVRYLAQSS